jgi:hypothetical protein
MSQNEVRESATDSFLELRKLIPNLSEPETRPEAYVRDIHRAWKDGGGTLAGKPRHSDRYLDDRLKANKMAVKSLTPKLVGKTRIKADDAEKMLRVLLTTWPQQTGSDLKNMKYGPLLPKTGIDEVIDYVVERIEYSAEAADDDHDAPARKEPTVAPVPGRDLGELFPTLFAESDALFVVATERANVAQSSKRVLIGFRDRMNELQSVEDEDGKERPVVWVLDLGKRSFIDQEARLRYVSFKDLQMRLKALEEFEDRRKDERWRWLSSRAVFVVHDIRAEDTLDLKGLKRPSYLPHHVSFTAIAPAWASSPNFRTLYGREMEDIHQRSFSVFFNAEGWEYDGEHVTEETQHCRYYGYAAFATGPQPNADKVSRGLELPFMGSSYEDAYKAVYSAATDLLSLPNRLDDATDTSGKQAAAQLGFLGFRLLRLNEFMAL